MQNYLENPLIGRPIHLLLKQHQFFLHVMYQFFHVLAIIYTFLKTNFTSTWLKNRPGWIHVVGLKFFIITRILFGLLIHRIKSKCQSQIFPLQK